MTLTSQNRFGPGVPRHGFTLVELLVAAALSVIIMYVIATAFKIGSDTMSVLKSAGGMSDQMRSAETIFRADLAAPHLENEDGDPILVSRCMGNWRMENRKKGCFHLVQADDLRAMEGFDGDGIDSQRAVGDWLCMTVKKVGSSPQSTFVANIRPEMTQLQTRSLTDFTPSGMNQASTFAGRWAEVIYYLTPMNNLQTNPEGGPPLPLYYLHRRQRVLSPESVVLDPALVPELTEISFHEEGGQLVVNTPEMITRPEFRFGNGTRPATAVAMENPGLAGTDVLLSGVISMKMTVMTLDGKVFNDTPGQPYLYDSYNAANPAGPPTAIKITLRIYDLKTSMTRQVSFVQPL